MNDPNATYIIIYKNLEVQKIVFFCFAGLPDTRRRIPIHICVWKTGLYTQNVYILFWMFGFFRKIFKIIKHLFFRKNPKFLREIEFNKLLNPFKL